MSAVNDESYAPEDRALAAWEITSVVSSVLLAERIVYSVAGGRLRLLAVPVAFEISVACRLKAMSEK